jgi:WD40 repeat protein
MACRSSRSSSASSRSINSSARVTVALGRAFSSHRRATTRLPSLLLPPRPPVATGQEVASLEGHRNWIESIAFSPAGALLATGDLNGIVRLWRGAP